MIMSKQKLKVSIITVSYNSSKTISDTIKSVQEQSYLNIEHVFIDGNSSDGTQEIIAEGKRETDIFVSEPDNGLYDAMNKGVEIASGDIIGILNSDDILFSNTTISKLVDTFIDQNVDGIFGNLQFVEPNNLNKVIRTWKGSPYKTGSFKMGWHPSHPTFYIRKSVYNNFGNYDITMNVSADFELMLRFIDRHKISTSFLDEFIVKMRYGGESTGSVKKILIGNRNVIKAFKKNGLKVSPLYPLYRLIPKVKQFFVK